MNVHGYAAQSATSEIAPFSFERRELRSNDVLIEILYCGVCHSDLHTARNDWGGTKYPVVPGHEIVGRVLETGSAVGKFSVGQIVAVGCMVDSCRHCHNCEAGLEQYCENSATFTYNGKDRHDGMPTYGGYSDRIVVSEDFVLSVPDGLDLAAVAPVLCAGITTWSPLRHWKVGPGSRVAVVGLGGLGHMALKLAKALGAEVTLISRSPGKADDARRLGASEVVISTDEVQMAAVKGKFELIIDTVPNMHELNPYIPLLSTSGTLVLVGFLGNLDEMLNTRPLIMGRKSIAGSLIGGIPETQELLDFCGEHGIVSDIETIRMDQINEAYERMLRSDVKYRFVIDMATLNSNE
ncbi:MAG: NAD(P)-dependent alcohol dehydrogenase [Planctomycetales bacterium]|nr:NAD(P)-dependent alcohol dehydrogenase [bacterium]UNM09482.1 MAG: NAD(P)-dependent alcohol dehydrogenase [Planctomycetales bacterium]